MNSFLGHRAGAGRHRPAGRRTPESARFAHWHRVDELIVDGGAVTGVRGAVLEAVGHGPWRGIVA